MVCCSRGILLVWMDAVLVMRLGNPPTGFDQGRMHHDRDSEGISISHRLLVYFGLNACCVARSVRLLQIVTV